ncbi:hypothetical protein B0J14DRAFT_607342 [Halenospora varia]|nr:hypothetical protein B0J14DRAFT_607342 [Halenospora varia]
MSSGFGPTAADCAGVEELALYVSRACRRSSQEFQNVAGDVSNLHLVLKDIKDGLIRDSTGLSHTRADALSDALRDTLTALKDLEYELQIYDRLTTSTQKKWDSVRFGLKDVRDIDMKIVCTTTSLRDLENKLASHSHSTIQKFMMKYLKEIGDGLHEGSILSTADGIDEKQNWEKFKKELEEQGIGRSVAREHRDFIQSIVRRAHEQGVVGEMDLDIPDDSDADTEISQTTTLVNKAVEEQQARRELNIDGLRKKGEHEVSKKHSRLVALGLRALRIVSDERLIEAADEGDLKRIEQLIHRGANVNASDKWRWTALHMAAYGGYPKIAEVLIKEGAELDVRTVDGETPLQLAERNAHVRVVGIITDEIARRDELREQKVASADDNDDW